MGQGRWKSKKRAHKVEPIEEERWKFWFSGVSRRLDASVRRRWK